MFDFSNVKPAVLASNRVTAFLVTANNCVFGASMWMGVSGNHSREYTHGSRKISAWPGATTISLSGFTPNGMGNGWYLTDGASNLVPRTATRMTISGLGQRFARKHGWLRLPPGAYFERGMFCCGCRSWFNSDDGYDCINAFRRW